MSSTTALDINNLFYINETPSSSSSSSSSNMTEVDPLRRLIHDVIAIGVSYFLTFLACDLIQFDYNIESAIKHLPLYVIGPYLFIFPRAWAKVKQFLKNEISKLLASIKSNIF